MAEIDYGSSDLSLIVSLAKQAGQIGMKYFKAEKKVWFKNGNSPVSEADKEIDDFLRYALGNERPEYGWLSEETEDNTDRLDAERVIIVDPIDGTRGFINDDKRWCVSIAIVEAGRPVHGVLFCPALNQTFAASTETGLFIENVPRCERDRDGLPLVTGSKKLIQTMRDEPASKFDVMDFVPSLAYRLALVAVGHLDGAFARPGASEWDVAAADIILRESQAKLTDKSGRALQYNRKKPHMPALAAANNSEHEVILGLANSERILQ